MKAFSLGSRKRAMKAALRSALFIAHNTISKSESMAVCMSQQHPADACMCWRCQAGTEEGS